MSYFGIPIRNGLPIGLGSVAPLASGGGSPFSPLSLFASGTPGVWYDPSDYSTLFQDSAGTTPVTAVEQPVGLMLDKSQGLVVSGTSIAPSFPASWSASSGSTLVGSTASFDTDANARIISAVSGSPSGYYDFSVTFSSADIGKKVRLAFWGTGVDGLASTDSSAFDLTIPTSGQVARRFFGLAVTNLAIRNGSDNVARSVTVVDISCRPVQGNHAFQATSASRPVLSARYNLLTKTEQFDDAVWTKQFGSITTSNVLAPNGTSTAEVFTPSAQFGNVRQMLATAITAGQVTVSVWLRTQSGTRDLFIRATASGLLYATQVTATTTWTRFTSTFTYDGTNPMNEFVVQDRNASGFVPFEVWGAQLVVTNSLTSNAYQRVNTATDYATTGFLPYLRFDGVDDSLSTNSISFTSTDKMSVFAGVRKLSDAAQALVVGLGNITQSGAMELFAPTSAAGNDFNFSANGGVTFVQAAAGSRPAPISVVAAGLIDFSLATGEVVNRINGVVAATSSGNAGSANFRSDSLQIGRRGGSSLPFNGQLYSMVIVGKAVTAGELSSTETYVNQKTGAY